MKEREYDGSQPKYNNPMVTPLGKHDTFTDVP